MEHREPPKSGSEAREQGRVEEYAAATKARLLALGQTEEQAEAHKQEIIKRWAEA